MRSRFLLMLLTALLSILHLSARAEDIDLFTGTTADQTLAPNLLLVLDNAANFSSNAAGSTCIIEGVATAMSGTVGGVEQCAIYSVVSSLVLTGSASVNLGIMVYNANNIVDWQGQPSSEFWRRRLRGVSLDRTDYREPAGPVGLDPILEDDRGAAEPGISRPTARPSGRPCRRRGPISTERPACRGTTMGSTHPRPPRCARTLSSSSAMRTVPRARPVTRLVTQDP